MVNKLLNHYHMSKFKVSVAVYVRKDMHLQSFICLGIYNNVCKSEKLRLELANNNPDLLFLAKYEEIPVDPIVELPFEP